MLILFTSIEAMVVSHVLCFKDFANFALIENKTKTMKKESSLSELQQRSKNDT